MEECHKLLTDQVDDAILRYNVSKPLPLRGMQNDIAAYYGSLIGGFKDNDSTLTDSHLKETDDIRDSYAYVNVVQIEVIFNEATGFEFKHDYTVIDSPMIMRFNEIHKFSDGTLQQIDEALDYREQGLHVRYPEKAKDTTYLSESGELCGWTDPRRRLPLHQLYLDEEALRETLEEQAMDAKVREKKIRQKQADDEEVQFENSGVAMILANVSVFTPKPSQHYLNITMRNVIEVFRKDTVLESGQWLNLKHLFNQNEVASKWQKISCSAEDEKLMWYRKMSHTSRLD
ncbi:retrovirus-related pol polyprotein from transposon TNT 1-94 [Tanacetum coccineum]|uniref:Retrovirus-related pol polyprotein from transposon TNT 1-94 n=1 Tax=Tanacetum coccineum TaxID=301880 RepID=A0ABQ5IVW3_9ASTR